MLLDSNSLSFVEKSLTRTEAKKVHKDLPEGGAWRTMNGHHIYIVNGKIVAGSVSGVTKAKKMTKQQMAEHQASIDAEGKKKGAKSKSGDSKKAAVNASKKSGGNTGKPKGTKSPAADKGTGKPAQAVKPPTKETKADGTATKPASKTKSGAKGAKSSEHPESTGNGKSVSNAKKPPSEGKPKSPVKGDGGADGAEQEEHIEVFHGTMLPTVEKIMKGGFKLNGGHSDFGNAAYFKSPSFDHKDHEDHQNWIKERQAKGQPVPDRYLPGGEKDRGNDSAEIVHFFTDRKNPAVIKAVIPKKHVLDCTNGRPKELQALIKDHEKHETEGTVEAMMGFALKHMLNMNVEGKNEDELDALFHDKRNQDAMKKFWGRDVKPFKVSPYEVYAKKNGVSAIVDKLDVFKDEGWQIGVYDPKLIQIKDTGKRLEWNHDKKTAELIKALRNALKNLPYALLHHEMTDEGLVMHIGAQGGGEDLEKSINRTQAKAVHKDLPPGGEWKTVKGHHIYIKDGKVLAGSIPGVTEGKAKKATKAQMAEHQEALDKAKKPTKKTSSKTKAPAKKEPKLVVTPKKPASRTKTAKGAGKDDTKPKKTAKGAQSGSGAKPAPDGKPKSAAKPTAKKTGAKSPSKSESAKKPKDIRSEAQKNRELAYDVGDKVGGARKDEFIKFFKEKPTPKNLEELEKIGGAVAEKMVTKANIFPGFDPDAEYNNGVDLPTTIMKKLLFDRIAPKPEPSNPETRKAYVLAMQEVYRHFAGIKSWDNMQGAIRELSNMARAAQRHDDAVDKLANRHRYSYLNEDLMNQYIESGKEAKGFMDYTALGDKFHNFLTNYESRDRTFKTVAKTAQGGWEKYLGKKQAAPKKERGAENKKWERKAEAEDLRTGGKKIKMDKPEQLMKEFGLRGVEFGNWVNDSSGKYHLQRSAEAFHDLADVIGVDPKDISLNGRLAIAFGARGKGGALAHYEPDRKVINMTKYGGAGSLAHEWGHAMDNILQQYSEGGRESLGHASDLQMGDHDQKLKALYNHLMDAITKPAPGEKGASVQMLLDSSAKDLSRYYPEMRRQVNDGMKPEDVYNHWVSKIQDRYNKAIASVKTSPYYKTDAERAKAIKSYENKIKRESNDIGHYLAHELRLKQNGGKYGGEHYKGHIEIPTGNSEYYQRMIETQPGKNQNGSHYWSQAPEMFARVFESWVQDKLDRQKRYNNYLVHGTREGNVKAEGAPFPLGKERQRMFKAMDDLMNHVSKGKTLKKALEMELQKGLSTGIPAKRSAYNVANPDDVIYIPINRLRTVYQTEKATNWDKVMENHKRMIAGDNLDPVSIGLDYDVHDGHHRIEASKKMGYEHVPCIVKGGNDIERQRAIEAYREVWKSFTWDDMLGYFKDKLKDGESVDGAYEETIEHFDRDYGEEMDFRAILKKNGYKVQDHFWVNKSIQPDPVAPDAFEDDEPYMFRGIGQKEMDFIRKNGYIQTKGKGNDEDKDVKTCFSNLYSQAAGYARSNYDLYNEKHAYVIAVPKREGFEDETGEIAIPGRVSIEGMKVIPIPKELEQP